MSAAAILADPRVQALPEAVRASYLALLLRQPVDGLTAEALQRLLPDDVLEALWGARLLEEVWGALDPCEAAPKGLPARYRAQTPGQADGAEVFAVGGAE